MPDRKPMVPDTYEQVTTREWLALQREIERLRTALLTISTADDPDAPISRKTCAAVAKAALNA